LAISAWLTLKFNVRRVGLTVLLTDIPLLLALFYLSPLLMLVIRLVAILVAPSARVGWIKLAFNTSTVVCGTAIANMVVASFPIGDDVGPRTWAVLTAAVLANQLVMTVALGGVILLIQGLGSFRPFVHSLWPVLIVPLVNVAFGLVILLALNASRYSVVLIVVLAIVIGVIYRTYAQFLGQHKNVAEMHGLTRAVGAAVHDGTLADVLLSQVRALMQAESATLWLPEHGRHTEVMLSARFDYAGLLDDAPTPDTLRQRAFTSGETVFVNARRGDEDLREHLLARDLKDAIVVPLRSGSVVVGTLEVASRLADQSVFSPDDVRLLETLAAHAGVAVENSRLVDRLRFDAYNDQLTGLPNRRRMLDALRETIETRAPGEVVGVLLFDVVNLREVNESLGYAAGDRVLGEVANRLRDLAPPEALVARVGGDEFAVELRTSSAEFAVAIADRLRTALRDTLVIDALTVEVDTNIGVAVSPDHGTDAESLLQRADLATQTAKVRNAVQLFNPGLESQSVRRLGLAGDLRVALEAGELEVHFQPKVRLSDRRLVGVECLARWEHPVHGSVSPQDFVAVAEHTGQLQLLTETVLRGGLRRAREWSQAGRSLSVSVNLCARSLADPEFPDQVAALLAEYGVAPERLTLEVTEVAVVGGDRPLPALRRLRELGVRLSIDDFGTGQSSLAHLRGLPVQEVKIDRTFVQGMATDGGDLAIVRTIVDMARHFGFAVVAEGVESELTLGLLEDIGCDMGQGFLFSRALPYERLEAWLEVQAEVDHAPAGEVRWLRAVP
jgi:diguanylate cyclase (GGDEF)-like protein